MIEPSSCWVGNHQWFFSISVDRQLNVTQCTRHHDAKVWIGSTLRSLSIRWAMEI